MTPCSAKPNRDLVQDEHLVCAILAQSVLILNPLHAPIWGPGPVPVHPAQSPHYLRSFRAVLGPLVAPGGSHRLSCRTAGCLGMTCSLLSLNANFRFTGFWLPALGFLSLTTCFAKRIKDLFKSRTDPGLEICPHSFGWKRPRWYRCPFPQH